MEVYKYKVMKHQSHSFSTPKIAWVSHGVCNKCGKNGDTGVLAVDTSNGEYGSLSLCEYCISNCFRGWEATVPKDEAYGKWRSE